MDLSTANHENLSYILTKIGEKLSVVNLSLLDPEDYDLEKYEDLKWLYEHVVSRDNLNASEIEAFIDELSSIRK